MYRVNSTTVGAGTGHGMSPQPTGGGSARKVYVRQDRGADLGTGSGLGSGIGINPDGNGMGGSLQSPLPAAVKSTGEIGSKGMFVRANSDTKVRPGSGSVKLKAASVPVVATVSTSNSGIGIGAESVGGNGNVFSSNTPGSRASSVVSDRQPRPQLRQRVSVLDLKPELHYNASVSSKSSVSSLNHNQVQSQNVNPSLDGRRSSNDSGSAGVNAYNKRLMSPSVSGTNTPVISPTYKPLIGTKDSKVLKYSPTANVSAAAENLPSHVAVSSGANDQASDSFTPNLTESSTLASSSSSFPSLSSPSPSSSFASAPAGLLPSPSLHQGSTLPESSPKDHSEILVKLPDKSANIISKAIQQESEQSSVSESMTLVPVLQPSDVTSLSAVSKARAERKIKDLEITNTSLLSINRYLEKKIHRQKKDIERLSTRRTSDRSSMGRRTTRNTEHGSDGDSDNDSDNESRYSGDYENSDLDESSLSSDFSDDEYSELDSSFIDTTLLDEVQERTSAHISFLKSAEKFDTMLRQCLIISDSLLNDAMSSLDFTVKPSDIGKKVVAVDAGESDDP
ncbi:hypothetical protein AWJ20_3881 [Sugiyamaella lignohabitans]|uniref:Uncharacterized protein n=1 Tax=Sugiyamaella lignohabitans TaxID=796027 RepID=A0A167C129_9ASCO|nr:uncharacterized protein AWJ20_3881 [Sugiyamaella lignohabitans]ANB11085.1 hypothetical protein AWJ20_3881 [Sugiyamaella lignohabitans]